MFAAENLRPFLANKITSGYSETKCCNSRMCRGDVGDATLGVCLLRSCECACESHCLKSASDGAQLLQGDRLRKKRAQSKGRNNSGQGMRRPVPVTREETILCFWV